MTREELLSVFPLPWRASDKDCGVILDANGVEVLTVDTNNDRADDDVRALVEMLAGLGNAAGDDMPQAARISVGACDFCPAVHVNLIDGNGGIFATASVPCAVGEAFIADFRKQMAVLANRASAPVTRQ